MKTSLASSLPAVAAAFLCAPDVAAQAGARFGHALVSADVNGDGASDVIVGEPFHDGVLVDEGRVLVYHGSPSGLASTPAWTRRGLQRGAHLGAALAAGDVNADGFADVVIGAPDFDRPAPILTSGPGAARFVGVFADHGAILVFLGSASGLSPAPALVRFGLERNEHFGIAVGAAGDVDGDGFGDLVVGATGTGANVGGAFVFRGSALGPQAFPSWIVNGDTSHAGFGFAVSGIGDFDGDGYDDIAVGAPDALSFGSDAGSVFLYRGSATGLESSPFSDLAGSDDMGWSVAAGGDLSGLGFGTVLAGDPGADVQGGGHSMLTDAGVASALSGPSGFQYFWTSVGGAEGGRFGSSVSAAGDTDGDGIPEVVYGAPGASLGSVSVGEPAGNHAMLLVGRSGSQPAAQFGFAVGSGDLDADGFTDVLVGEPAWDGSALDIGRVHAYRGSASGLGANAAWTIVAP